LRQADDAPELLGETLGIDDEIVRVDRVGIDSVISEYDRPATSERPRRAM
jgi:hypothetical protein